MAFEVTQMIRMAKRLQEATGYLELGMSQQTLDSLSSLGDGGPFKAAVTSLRNKALQLQHGGKDTAVALQEQLELDSSPETKETWLTLSLCYQLAGSMQHAVQALAQARGAKPVKD